MKCCYSCLSHQYATPPHPPPGHQVVLFGALECSLCLSTLNGECVSVTSECVRARVRVRAVL